MFCLGEGGCYAGVLFVAAVTVGVCFPRGVGRAGRGRGEPLLPTGPPRPAGGSCFCGQRELLFTGDFDNSGCVPSDVCVSELFNFVLCLYGEYLCILSQVSV